MRKLSIVLITLLLLLFNGCSWLCEPEIKVVYVTTKCPKLSTIQSDYNLSVIDSNVTLRIIDAR